MARMLRDRLVEIGFGPQAAPRLFGVSDMTEIRANRAALYDQLLLPQSAAGKAARFFVLHEAQPEPEVRKWLGADLLRFLADVGAIARGAAGWKAIAGLTWFGEQMIFTDARMFDVVWPGAEPFPDYVMPPGVDSIGLLRVAPRRRVKALLDICCGAGTQALAASEYSDKVIGVDVNPRALRFAQFNAAANGVEHAEFILSDVYDRVPSMRFGAIVSNPPFVPWPEEDEASLLFRGGGARGEDVIIRIFAGAIDSLEHDGFLSMVADFADAQTLGQRLNSGKDNGAKRWDFCSSATICWNMLRVIAGICAEATAKHRSFGSSNIFLRRESGRSTSATSFNALAKARHTSFAPMRRRDAPSWNRSRSGSIVKSFGAERILTPR